MTNFTQWLPYIAYVFVVLVGMGLLTSKKRTAGQLITIVTFGVYLTVVGYLTLTPTSFAYGIVPTMEPVWVGTVPTNPIPFRGIELDFYMNILMMIPMGVYFGLFRQRSTWQITLIGVLIGTSIESTQFVLDMALHMSRWVDINDVITNAAGVVVGYLAVMLLKHSPFKRVVRFFSLNKGQLVPQKI